jgi:hypothetical protein
VVFVFFNISTKRKLRNNFSTKEGEIFFSFFHNSNSKGFVSQWLARGQENEGK